MHPELTGDVSAYPAFLGAGVLIGVAVGIWRLHRSGLHWVMCLRLEIALVVAGLLGSKTYALWERGGSLWELTELSGTHRYPGGIIAVAVVFVLFRRRLLAGISLGSFADAIAPATGLALGIARLGCFANGCCFGRESHLPWAVQFPAHSPVWSSQLASGQLAADMLVSLPVHPLQVYFALASIALALFACWFDRRKSYSGQTGLLFLALDGMAKLGLETLRGEPMTHLQLSALATALVAAVALFVCSFRLQRIAPNHASDDAMLRALH